MCSKQSATNWDWLIGKCHTFLEYEMFLLESSGKTGKAHFLCGAALCVESRVSWLEGVVLTSTNCAAFFSAFVYPSRNCPSVCLSHTVVLLRDIEKFVHIASDFSHKSFSLSGWSYQAPLAWECDHRMSHWRKTIFTLLEKSAMNRSFMRQKLPQYTVV